MGIIFSLVLLVLGGSGVFWANKRRFERRNMAGVEEFSSYGKALLTKGGEQILRLASWLLVFVGGAGLVSALFLR